MTRFDEESVWQGRYGSPPVSHLELLRLLGVTAGLRPVAPGAERPDQRGTAEARFQQ